VAQTPVKQTGEGTSLEVWVQPRAALDGVAGMRSDALKVKIAAPPVDGEANDALIRYLSKRLGIPRSRIVILRGHSGRRKTLLLQGLSAAETERLLGL